MVCIFSRLDCGLVCFVSADLSSGISRKDSTGSKGQHYQLKFSQLNHEVTNLLNTVQWIILPSQYYLRTLPSPQGYGMKSRM